MNDPTSPPPSDAEVEQAIKTHLERGATDDVQRAVERAIEHYGQRLCAFILGLVKDPATAADVQQDLWIAVYAHAPRFRWESSFKGWLYLLARRMAIKAVQRDRQRHERAGVPLSQAAESRLAAHLATSIAMWKKDDFKQRFRALRDQLSEKDRTLLVMRADQELPFREIALALAEPDENLDAAALKTRETTLMKRFQRVKQRLYQLALEAGLVPSAEE